MRTGILGGTFNPIHYGHLRPAEEVREALGLEQVRFIPLAGPAHKLGNDIAPAKDRLEMVRLALEEHPFFVCDPIEIERGGVSYTIDTLTALAEGDCRGHELYFIIGADAFSLLDTWREPLGVLQKANFAITLRGNQAPLDVIETVESVTNKKDIPIKFNQISDNEFQVVESEMIANFVSVTTFDVSATMIRELAHSRASLRYLLPQRVEAFILRRGLYGSEGQALQDDRELDRSFDGFRERLGQFYSAVESKKGLDIVVLDLRGLSSELDAFIICHGTNPRQVRAITEAVEEKLIELGEKPLFVEGAEEANWVLIDCADVGIHIFQDKIRDYYRLEELWSHAPAIDIGVPGTNSEEQNALESK